MSFLNTHKQSSRDRETHAQTRTGKCKARRKRRQHKKSKRNNQRKSSVTGYLRSQSADLKIGSPTNEGTFLFSGVRVYEGGARLRVYISDLSAFNLPLLFGATSSTLMAKHGDGDKESRKYSYVRIMQPKENADE